MEIAEANAEQWIALTDNGELDKNAALEHLVAYESILFGSGFLL